MADTCAEPLRNDKPQIALILGGARSGKSRRGESLAIATGLPVAYVATCPRDLDEEMSDRIRLHRDARPAAFKTVENSYDLRAIAAAYPGHCLLVDCLTLWLYVQTTLGQAPSNEAILLALGSGLEATMASVTWIIISSEVGMGIVPASAESRRFRDLSGSAHQLVASMAGRVELMVAGLPLRVK